MSDKQSKRACPRVQRDAREHQLHKVINCRSTGNRKAVVQWHPAPKGFHADAECVGFLRSLSWTWLLLPWSIMRVSACVVARSYGPCGGRRRRVVRHRMRNMTYVSETS